jgi:hypothetical protein
MRCESMCGAQSPFECDGEVKRVEVFGKLLASGEVLDADYSWGEFHYCERAIDADRQRGFRVEIID